MLAYAVQELKALWDGFEGVKGGGGWRGGEEMEQADCESEHTRLRVSPRGTTAGLFRGPLRSPAQLGWRLGTRR